MTRRRPGLAATVTGLLAALALAGCVSVPDSGPVVEAGDSSDIQADEPPDIVPAPPQSGESASDVVKHFLEAMRASPIDTTVARQFLTQDAAAAWNPEQETITYVSTSGPFGSSPLRVKLLESAHFDARGTWLGALPADRRTLRFPMQLEEGEWRIADAPDALIVNKDWFDQRFQQVSLYFFDLSGTFLVPEPVFLPRGDQLPTALTQRLLAGPPAELRRVERTFVPPGMTLDLSVPPVVKGVAEVALSGSGARATPDETTLMLAQLTWTLRQVPGLQSLRLTVDGQSVNLAGDDGVSVDSGAEYDPTGWVASATPFALQRGRVVGDAIDDPQPVAGPFGTKRFGLRSIAVDPNNTKVAGVADEGRTVYVTSVSTPDARVSTVAQRATDLLPPAWDLAGRLWLVDRRSDGALVSVVVDGAAPQAVRAPGIEGRRVRAFEVSRDGTRFVAVVADGASDAILVGRVRRTLDGTVSLTRAVRMPWAGDTPLRARDLGWRDATTAAVLNPLTDELFQVSAVPLDGSPGRSIATIRGVYRTLVSSPVESEPSYVVSQGEIFELGDVSTLTGQDGVLLPSLTYVG